MRPPDSELQSKLASCTEEQQLVELLRQEHTQELAALQTQLEKLQADLQAHKGELAAQVTACAEQRQLINELRVEQGQGCAKAAAPAQALQSSLATVESARSLRNQQAKRVRYILSDESPGSFPDTLFDSIPASALKVLYTGAYQAPTDELGRVVIDCDRVVWHQICAFARCGAVPDGLQPELLAQARAWNIDPLAQTLEARIPGVVEIRHHQGTGGLTARMNFVGLENCDFSGQHLELNTPSNERWALEVDQDGTWCRGVKNEHENFKPRLQQKFNLRLLLKDTIGEFKGGPADFKAEDQGFGRSWSGWGYTWHTVTSESVAQSRGCLVVELDIIKK